MARFLKSSLDNNTLAEEPAMSTTRSLLSALIALGLLLGAAAASADETRLPGDAYTRRWCDGSHAVIIPSYNPHSAPATINVGGKTYRRDSFNMMQTGGRTFMAYTETADSMAARHTAAQRARDARNRRNSW
jgi:hypothetical protein